MAVSIKLSQLLQRTSLDRFNPNFPPIAVLIAMPLIMALFSREWLYTPIG